MAVAILSVLSKLLLSGELSANTHSLGKIFLKVYRFVVVVFEMGIFSLHRCAGFGLQRSFFFEKA